MRHDGATQDMAIAVETTAAPTPGLALICADAPIRSPLVAGTAVPAADPQLCAELAATILAYGRFDVVMHASSGREAALLRAAIAGHPRLVPELGNRLRISEGMPLGRLLAGVDLLVSFASPALVTGCRSGLKPVQIGPAVIGTAAFSDIFAATGELAAALAAGGLAGRLTLDEYRQFEVFCGRTAGRGAVMRQFVEAGPASAWRLIRDPIRRACRRRDRAARLALQALASAFANPFAAWRLLRGALAATVARSSRPL